MHKDIKDLMASHPKGIQEFIEMDLMHLIVDLEEDLKEDELGDTPSKNENTKVEDMFDYIAGQIFGIYKNKQKSSELLEAIRLFGKMRFNQAIDEVYKLKFKHKKLPLNSKYDCKRTHK